MDVLLLEMCLCVQYITLIAQLFAFEHFRKKQFWRYLCQLTEFYKFRSLLEKLLLKVLNKGQDQNSAPLTEFQFDFQLMFSISFKVFLSFKF